MKVQTTRVNKRSMHVQGFSLALLSAIFFSFNVPVTKWLLTYVSPYWLASLLYAGAGIGTFIFKKLQVRSIEKIKPVRYRLSWFALMIVLDIIAPIFFLFGSIQTDGNLIGLLSNAELIFTLVFAIILFKESLNGLSWSSLCLILAGIFVANIGVNLNTFNVNGIFIIIAALLWGFENNISRKLSFGNPLDVVIIKGFGTGLGTLIIALVLNESIPNLFWIGLGLVFGFLIYGVSLIFYVTSQRQFGAAKVQLIQSFAPILGGIIAWFVFQETLMARTLLGYGLVIIALILMGYDAMRKPQP